MRENDSILIIAVVSVGLGVLLLMPGLGILYFLALVPVLIVLRRESFRPQNDQNIAPSAGPFQAPQTAIESTDGPLPLVVRICLVFVSLIGAFIAFGITCTGGVFSTLILADSVNLGNGGPFPDFLVFVIPLVSFLVAIVVFVKLFRVLVLPKKR